MKLNALVYLIVLKSFGCVLCHMPTLYEFCSHVVANENPGRIGSAQCAIQCQGRVGKIGPVGPRGISGPKGEKGERGEQENTTELEAKVQHLEDLEAAQHELVKNFEAYREVACYMGIKSGGVPDSALTSSSDWNSNYVPVRGRLDVRPTGSLAGCWTAGKKQVGEWIQVDLGEPKPLGGIITQGRNGIEYGLQFVSSFKVTCGNTVSGLSTVLEDGRDKVFAGNSDQNTKITNLFPSVLVCRYVRVYPQTWTLYLSMRFELIHGRCHEFLQ